MNGIRQWEIGVGRQARNSVDGHGLARINP
jgi:hypothetical protein